MLHLVAKRIEAKVEPQIEHNHPKLHQTIPILFFKNISRNGLYRGGIKKMRGKKTHSIAFAHSGSGSKLPQKQGGGEKSKVDTSISTQEPQRL